MHKIMSSSTISEHDILNYHDQPGVTKSSNCVERELFYNTCMPKLDMYIVPNSMLSACATAS